VRKAAKRRARRATRPARTPIHDIRARLGTLECTVANLSLTGAMLRAKREVAVGRDAVLALNLEPQAVTGRARVARCEPLDVPLPGAVWRQQQYAIGVHFLDPSAAFSAAVRSLIKSIGIEHSQPRVLVLGEGDKISDLIEKTLSEADYVPRVLTHPGYALSTARRIGAKAIILSLNLDPKFSGRQIIETIRADAAMARLPIILCVRRAWLQPAHSAFITHQRVRLLLVPFTPEELVLTLDRMIEEAS